MLTRVNVGCGVTPTPGWINIDNSASVRMAALPILWPFLDTAQRRLAKATRDQGIAFGTATRLPLADGSVEVVYSSHMMEHLDRSEATRFLYEAQRVLAPGGIIRLALPDLRRKADEYMREGDADRFVESIMMGADRPRTLRQWLKHVLIGPRHHLWMYDGRSLTRLLENAGFVDTVVWPAGETKIADPGTLDLRERDDESVYVEAVKPLR